MCGLFGITGADDASKLAYLGLFALQHRGQESAGICSIADKKLYSKRGPGLVADVFNETNLAGLPGNAAVGHVRYSTAGGNLEANIQPLTARIGGVPITLSHNGNIVNADLMRENLENGGAILQGTADSEMVLHLLARAKAGHFQDKLLEACKLLRGAVSLLVLTPTHLYGVVDAAGYRPLVLGKLPVAGKNPAWVLCSETCALDLVGAELVRDILPGEVIAIDLETGKQESNFFPLTEQQSNDSETARCSFEQIYFARPDSVLWGKSSLETRSALGQALAKQFPAEADIVIAIPDSGNPMAMGYAQESGIPFQVGLIRNHYVGRTFIEPTQNVRNFRVRLKLNPVREVVRGKRVVVVDDSIVRGTTSKKIIELLRDAGAKEIHMRIGSPPVKFPCFYGIDTPKRKELLAQKMSLEEVKDYLRADSLAFLSTESMVNVLAQNSGVLGLRKGFCTSCFSGKYQDTYAQTAGNPEYQEEKKQKELREHKEHKEHREDKENKVPWN